MQHRETGTDTKQYKKTALRAVKIRRYMQKYHAPIGVRSRKNEKNSATKKMYSKTESARRSGWVTKIGTKKHT